MKLSVSNPAFQRLGFLLLSMGLVALMTVVSPQMNIQKSAPEACRIFWCGNYVPEDAPATLPIAWCGNHIRNQHDQCYPVQREAGGQVWVTRVCPVQ